MQLANPDIGRIKVTYRRVECAPPQDIQVSVMDFAGSNGWLRLVIKVGGAGRVQRSPAELQAQFQGGGFRH